MSANLIVQGPGPIVVDPTQFLQINRLLDDDEFFHFCQVNSDLRIERSSKGDIIIMPPTGGETAIINSKLNRDLGLWAERDGTGQVFDSSGGFVLPNGATRSPDISWVRNERWASVPSAERKRFPPLTPDFVVELLSESDSLKVVQEKMGEYLANGAQLGWLIDPFEKKIHVYRPDGYIEILEDPKQISGDPLLKGFTVDVQSLWEVGE